MYADLSYKVLKKEVFKCYEYKYRRRSREIFLYLQQTFADVNVKCKFASAKICCNYKTISFISRRLLP